MEESLQDLKNKARSAFDAWLDLNEKIPERIRKVVNDWLMHCHWAVNDRIKRDEDQSLD